MTCVAFAAKHSMCVRNIMDSVIFPNNHIYLQNKSQSSQFCVLRLA